MFRKNIEIIFVIIAVLAVIGLSGCPTNSDAVKSNNVNQSPLIAANNNNFSVNSPPNNSESVVNNASSMPPSVNNSAVNKNMKSVPPVKEPTPVVGSGGDDLFLFAQVRGALSSDNDLLNAVIVQIKEGNAVLSGNVASEAQKTKAEQLVKNVKGVKSVKNNLRVSSK